MRGMAAAGWSIAAGRGGGAFASFRGGWRERQVLDVEVGSVSESRVVGVVGRFDLVGVSWSGPGGAVWLRVRRDGAWSRWVDASPRGHEPDGFVAAGSRTVGEPVWAGGCDAVEVRGSRVLTGVRLHLVRALLPAVGSAASLYAIPVYPAGPGQPQIIARHVWANAACRPRKRAGVGDVRLGFVHHTENANSYTPAQSAAMVQAICLFHRNVRGWNDIGYNFLVDRYGQIFEGRAGGIDEPVVGAQAGGYNLVSTGVGVLGNFLNAEPSAAAVDALERLLAWKLSLHGVPAQGDIDVVVNKAGAVYSKYPAGAHVTLKRISGHRDADSTDCPGDAMYRRLPELRRGVAQLAGAIGSLSLTGPKDPPVGAPASVGGVLSILDGAPIGGAALALQVHDRHRARTIATATTAGDGTWSAPVAAPHRILVRAVFAGDGAHAAVISPYFELTFAPVVTLGMGAPGTVAIAGQPLAVMGTVTPVKKRVRLELLAADAAGALSHVATATVRVGSGGAFRGAVTPPSAGRYRVVARTDADKLNGPGTSVPVDFVVG